jgi:U3 small nucleolar RNA-associated protein 14
VRRAAAEAAGEEADLLTPLPDARAGLTQADLVAAAFAGDDVGADFAAAKAAEAGAELPDPDAAVAAAGLDMPGWGAWAASSAPRRAAAAAAVRSAAERDRAAAASRRRDARLPGVILSERWDKKAAKYATPAVPHPFPDAAAYEASMRAPLGRDFNTDASFRDAVRPALITAPGAIIKPARFSAAAARAAGEAAALSNGARKRTAVVAGGMPKRTRR